jgi:tetratricopeptide (TPR) repeat protein
MADANQLKIEARRKEASGDYAAASQLYQRALAAMEDGNSLPDPSLLVRVADLEYRQDEQDSALSYYHRAVEDYAEQGLITNAIAVCNKILRVFPEEISCYRRLADLHMDVGLVAEARQNMLRYVDQAWDRGDTDPALAAMEELLARSPDQEIALKMATCLARLDRKEDALEVLARVWRERTRADADVEALERKARDLEPDVDMDEWLPSTEDADEEPGLAGADSFVSEDPSVSDDSTEAPAPETSEAPEASPEPEPIEAYEEPPVRSPLDELAAAAEGLAAGPFGDADDGSYADDGRDVEDEDVEDEEDAPVAAPEPATIANRLEEVGENARELELVASFPDWFTEMAMTRPSNGAPPGPAGSGTDTWEERTMDELDRDELDRDELDRDELDRRDELEARAEAEVATADDDPGAEAPSAADPHGGPDGGSESGVGRDGRGGPDHRDAAASPGGPRARPGDPSGPSAPDLGGEVGGALGDIPGGGSRGGNDLGEEEELRRGLDLLDELLEVDPDNVDLMERKVRYARRLEDRDELVGAYLDLADAMAERGSRRGARLLYNQVLELDAGNQQAEAGLGRLDRGELEQKRQTGKRAGAAHATPRDPSPEEKEARRHLGMRLWTEFEKAVQEMPWLHAATQTYQSTSPEAAPPVEAFEMLAHYLISRDRCREAADILEQAVKVADRSDEEIADALYYLGVAHDRLGESEKAAGYFRRLDEVDHEFASVRQWLPANDEGSE